MGRTFEERRKMIIAAEVAGEKFC